MLTAQCSFRSKENTGPSPLIELLLLLIAKPGRVRRGDTNTGGLTWFEPGIISHPVSTHQTNSQIIIPVGTFQVDRGLIPVHDDVKKLLRIRACSFRKKDGGKMQG